MASTMPDIIWATDMMEGRCKREVASFVEVGSIIGTWWWCSEVAALVSKK